MSNSQQLVGSIRGLVISQKGGMNARRLYADFKEVGGEDSQFTSLGFHNLEQFVRAHPEEFRISNGIVTAVLKAESSHISKLVQQQNNAKKGRGLARLNPPPTSRRPVRGMRPSLRMPPRFMPPRLAAKLPGWNSAPPPRARSPERWISAAPEGSYVPRLKVGWTSAPEAGSSERRVYIAPAGSYVPPHRNNDLYHADQPVREKVRPPRNVSKLMEQAFADVEKDRRTEDLQISLKREEIHNHALTNQGDHENSWTRSVTVSDRSLYSAQGHVNGSRGGAGEWAREVTFTENRVNQINGDWRHNGEDNNPISEFRAKDLPVREPYRHRPSGDEGVPGSGETSHSVYNSTRDVIKEEIKDRDATGEASRESKPSYFIRHKPKYNAQEENVDQYPLLTKNRAAMRLLKLDAERQAAAKEPSDDIERLKMISSMKGLMNPDYEILTTRDSEQLSHTCILKVGDEHFCSSPSPDEKEAKLKAAKKALDKLDDFVPVAPRKINLMPIVDTESTGELLADQKLFLIRVREMTENNNVWFDSLPEAYKNKFSCEVPGDWCEVLDKCPYLTTSISFGRKLVEACMEPAVLPEAQEDSKPSQETAPPPDCSLDAPFTDVPSRVTNRVEGLPLIIIPEDGDYWDLYIMNIDPNNSYHVWARFIGQDYSEKYDEMINSLEIDMMERNSPCKFEDLEVGGLYATNFEDSWARVTLKFMIDEEDTAVVIFIDNGQQDLVSIHNLFPLDAKYCDVAPQAFKVALDGFDDFPNMPQLEGVRLEHLVGKSRVAELKEIQRDDSDDVIARVVLWDTSSPEDVNINLLLMETAVRLLEGPDLNKGFALEMKVSHIAESRTMYLQKCGPEIKCLQSLIDYTINTYEDISLLRPISINYNSIYLIKKPGTEKYCRVKCLSTDNSTTKVHFLDFGSECTVTMGELLEAEELSPALVQAPAQAVKVALHNMGELSEATLRLFRSYVDHVVVVAKVVNMDDGLPNVELFCRSGPDSSITNINNKLKLPLEESGLFEGSDDDEEIECKDFELPSIGSLFNVTITMAASPDVFQVQSAEFGNEISSLMNDLQDVCSKSTKMLSVTDLTVGRVVAVFYSDDQNWYRGKILGVVGRESASVRLCDFGNIYIVSVSEIRILPPEFRHLPCLAVRATLYGVTPKNGDWTPDDCVFFQDVVLNRYFASLVRKVTTSDSDGPVLHLELIDTSSDNDVYISQLLVEHGMANIIPAN